jgi:hypothetical protein
VGEVGRRVGGPVRAKGFEDCKGRGKEREGLETLFPSRSSPYPTIQRGNNQIKRRWRSKNLTKKRCQTMKEIVIPFISLIFQWSILMGA